MSNALCNASLLDGSQINVDQKTDLDYWTEKLDVTPEELKRVVAKVGPMVGAVRRELSLVTVGGDAFHTPDPSV
jgi:hypothetical protein